MNFQVLYAKRIPTVTPEIKKNRLVLKKSHEVALFEDLFCMHKKTVFDSKNAPTKRNKYVTIEGNKYRIVWR